MNRSSTHLRCGDSFRRIESIAQTLPGVEVPTKYDGSPVLKVSGRFMAGLATHWSAEPESLVVRCEPDDRTGMIEEAAETYYVTDYYQPHPVVLARLSRLDDGVLRELLAISRKLTLRRASTDHAFE